PSVHVRYEELVRDPETHFRSVCDHLGIPFEAEAIAYGEKSDAPTGLGDPTGVARHTRPVTDSVSKWAAEIAARPETLALVSKLVDQLDPADLETLGYPRAEIVEQLEAARGAPVPVKGRAPGCEEAERESARAGRRGPGASEARRARSARALDGPTGVLEVVQVHRVDLDARRVVGRIRGVVGSRRRVDRVRLDVHRAAEGYLPRHRGHGL